MTPQEMLAAGWTKRGLIWIAPAEFPEPPDEELEPLNYGNWFPVLEPCGTKAAKRRHQRHGVTCIVCENLTWSTYDRYGKSKTA